MSQCDTDATLATLRTWCEATGDGGEPSGRAQPCMALTLMAWNGPGPTFRSTANAGAARLRSAAPGRGQPDPKGHAGRAGNA